MNILLKYGRNYYDYQEGTLVFVSPGQVMDIETDGQIHQPKGHGLVFHPDLIRGTPLANTISDYNFFSYKTNEALHVSEKERQIIMDCFSKINYELQQGVDKHSKRLIASNIELFLNYCDRFYDRQFITRDNENHGIIEKFEILLNCYFGSEKPLKIGLPTVAYFAEELHLSANYFGDVKKRKRENQRRNISRMKSSISPKIRLITPTKRSVRLPTNWGSNIPSILQGCLKTKWGIHRMNSGC